MFEEMFFRRTSPRERKGEELDTVRKKSFCKGDTHNAIDENALPTIDRMNSPETYPELTENRETFCKH